MKRLLPLILLTALAACNGSKQSVPATPLTPALTISGEWRLAEYTTDQLTAIDSQTDYILTISEDSVMGTVFGMQTDCNTLGGQFTASGDSVSFGNITCTQMMCPNETIEMAMKQILPQVDALALTDSTLTLTAEGKEVAKFERK